MTPMGKKTRARSQNQPASRPQQVSPKAATKASSKTIAKAPSLPDVQNLPGSLAAVGAFYGRAIPTSLHALRWGSQAQLALAPFAALWLVFLIGGIAAITSGGFGQGIGYGIAGLLLGLVLSVFVGLIPFGYIFRGVMAVERREYDRFSITNRNRNLPVRVSLWFQKTARQTLAKQGMPNARLAARPPAKKTR
jgi:hypothetical protein